MGLYQALPKSHNEKAAAGDLCFRKGAAFGFFSSPVAPTKRYCARSRTRPHPDKRGPIPLSVRGPIPLSVRGPVPLYWIQQLATYAAGSIHHILCITARKRKRLCCERARTRWCDENKTGDDGRTGDVCRLPRMGMCVAVCACSHWPQDEAREGGGYNGRFT